MIMLRKLVPLTASRTLTQPRARFSVVHPSVQYDVVIVGGGLIGNAAAVALGLEERMENKKILLLDQSEREPSFEPDNGFNLRVINLTVGNQEFLDGIGAWDRIKDMRFNSYNKIYNWESNSNHTISFTADPMGYIVENNVIETSLLDIARNLHNVDIRRGEEVKEIKLPLEESREQVTLGLASGDVVETDLLIGADGANSYVRKTLDSPVISWMYDQQGIVCTLRSPCLDKDDVAYQRFLPSGPIALLPLGDGLFSLVWSCKSNIANELINLPDEDFVARANNALQKRANVPPLVAAMETVSDKMGMLEYPPTTPLITEIEGPRAKFPLGFSNSTRYIGPRTALLGDAAHRVHPLAGQGANIGFRGVQELIRNINNHPDRGIGDYKVLNSFESGLQRQVTPMLAFIDGMYKLNSTSFDPIVAARSFGLGMVNQLPMLKNIILDRARS